MPPVVPRSHAAPCPIWNLRPGADGRPTDGYQPLLGKQRASPRGYPGEANFERVPPPEVLHPPGGFPPFGCGPGEAWVWAAADELEGRWDAAIERSASR